MRSNQSPRYGLVRSSKVILSTLNRNVNDCPGAIVKFSQVGYTQIMEAYYSDTDPKMEALQIRLLRQAPPWRKMEMLVSLNASARELALAGLRRRYPNADENELRRRLADILFGETLAAKVYGARTEDAA